MEPSTESATRKEFLVPVPCDPKKWEDRVLAKRVYTVDDYMSLPEGAPYQLIGGQLVMNPSPTTFHQDVSRNLEFALLAHVEKNDSGYVFDAPLDVHFTDRDVFQPDIIFVSKERRRIVGRKTIDGAPDLIVEIISPSTAYYDLRKKFRTYERENVLEYWIVDPGLKRIDVFENVDGKFRLFEEAENEGSAASKILDGFSVDLKTVFKMSRIEDGEE